MAPTRRQFAALGGAAALLPVVGMAQSRALPEITSVPTDVYTEIPGAHDLLVYSGENPHRDLWHAPSSIEGQALPISGTIRHRWVAPENYGFETGYEGDVFRSLIWVTLDGNLDAFLAANSDLAGVKGARTFVGTGSYGGIFDFRLGGIREVPLVLVVELNSGAQNR